jgi:hypothetical protein
MCVCCFLGAHVGDMLWDHAHERVLHVPALGACMCVLSHELAYVTHAWVFVLGEQHAHGMCGTCLFLGERVCLMSFTHAYAWAYSLRGVHAHAVVMRVPAFGCANARVVLYVCSLDARVGVYA